MSKILYLSFLLVFFLPLSAQAVGGGGGGSAPSCTSDTWSCGEWSLCSAAGAQARACTMTFDCDTAANPKPAETQSCTPPCFADQWECGNWDNCSADGKQARNCTKTFDCPFTETAAATKQSCAPPSAPSPVPAPAPEPPAKPTPAKPAASCSADTWKCTDWSACDPEGNQNRKCDRTFDCSAANTPSPRLFQRCATLQCGNKPTLYDRVFCRLNLTPAGMARELELQYLPEECRSLSDVAARDQCIATYQSYKPCWKLPVGAERTNCAKQALGLEKDTLAVQLERCITNGKTKAACQEQMRDQVYSLIKFRIYDLEERAEELAEEGANLATVAKFVAFIQEQKQAFNAAKDFERRQKVILDVRAEWNTFVNAVKDDIK